MDWRERIQVDPKVLTGKQVIKGTRISVEIVLDLLSKGWTTDQVIESYPGVTLDDIRACLACASEALSHEKAYPAPSA